MVKAGDVLADGPACDMGELALGQNVLVAFMPWQGYNFEDSILVSERIAKDDVFTSIHIEEFECVARDTKLGKEEITKDIPNVGEEALKDLDDVGHRAHRRRGEAGRHPGRQDHAEGREPALPGGEAAPRDLRRKGRRRARQLAQGPAGRQRHRDQRPHLLAQGHREGRARPRHRGPGARAARAHARRGDRRSSATRSSARSASVLVGKTTTGKLVDDKGKVLLEKGAMLDDGDARRDPAQVLGRDPGRDGRRTRSQQLLARPRRRWSARAKSTSATRSSASAKGDELPPGVIKMVKVYIAIKRKLQVGDKMAGRHGNKGVVSRILPEEDMPYLADGTPVDIVLNPLGVPSRMNVGQILETHLGWGARELGRQIQRHARGASSAPDKLREQHHRRLRARQGLREARRRRISDEDVMTLGEEARARLVLRRRRCSTAPTESDDQGRRSSCAGLPPSGQAILFDGRTGEPFDQDVTVGVMYMLKLHHLVDDKIHARSIGPYSLVTQQPLGGKAQFGGQRLGEMEVWAMEAYGAAYALQEFLTVKSDDVQGRTRMYEAIVKGDYTLEAGLPESFNVLIKELQSLCLNVELVEDQRSLRPRRRNDFSIAPVEQ